MILYLFFHKIRDALGGQFAVWAVVAQMVVSVWLPRVCKFVFV